MRRIAPLFAIAFLLSSCAGGRGNPNPKELLHNPLAAETTADQMLDFVAMLQIRAEQKNKAIDDRDILNAIDDALVRGKTMQKDAYEKQDMGKMGNFYGASEDGYAAGEALLLDDMLYFGFNFEASGAPDTHVYLAKHVAPHTPEELFSEETVDVGPLRSIYGAQSYKIPELPDTDWNEYRTVVLYSDSFKMVIGLAQIRGYVK